MNQSTKEIKALVVEDDLDALEILLHILQTADVQCQSTKSGAQAIAYFEKHQPDITFLDIDIPAPNGIDTLAAIKKLQSSAKVVMVTGSKDINTVKKAVALGAYGYVVKPFVPEKILSLLNKLND